jgi:hypothetical protein
MQPDPYGSGPVDIDLTCPGCSGVVETRALKGVVFGMSGCVRWLENGTGALDSRPLLESPPIIGGTYTLEVRHPFAVPDGASIWVSFEPGPGQRDGWAAHPALLPGVGVARIRPRRFMGARSSHTAAEAQRGWIVAHVEELVFALDVPNRFKQSPNLALPGLSEPWPREDTEIVEHGNIALVTCTLPRGQRRRALVLQSPLALPTLVMLEDVGFHDASLVAFPRRLTAAQAGTLRDPAGAFPMRWR